MVRYDTYIGGYLCISLITWVVERLGLRTVGFSTTKLRLLRSLAIRNKKHTLIVHVFETFRISLSFVEFCSSCLCQHCESLSRNYLSQSIFSDQLCSISLSRSYPPPPMNGWILWLGFLKLSPTHATIIIDGASANVPTRLCFQGTYCIDTRIRNQALPKCSTWLTSCGHGLTRKRISVLLRWSCSDYSSLLLRWCFFFSRPHVQMCWSLFWLGLLIDLLAGQIGQVGLLAGQMGDTWELSAPGGFHLLLLCFFWLRESCSGTDPLVAF